MADILATAVDLQAAVGRAKVALLHKSGKKILCILFRNFDGAHGRRLLQSTHILPSEFLQPYMPRMAEACRVSAVTTGTTEGNDVSQLVYRNSVPAGHLVRRGHSACFAGLCRWSRVRARV
jgi:hypothetical protein